MAMFRRSRKPAPPLHRKQQEIAQQEAQLREKVESLERIVTQSRAPAQNKSSAARAGPQRNQPMLSKSDFTSQSQWTPRRCLTLIEGAGGLVQCAKSVGRGGSSF